MIDDEGFSPGNFCISRDQFILQENGYGRIVGRLKEMIIRGGENIFPKEIEDFLNTHPNILDTQVILLFFFCLFKWILEFFLAFQSFRSLDCLMRDWAKKSAHL